MEEELLLEKKTQTVLQRINRDIHEAVYYIMAEYKHCLRNNIDSMDGGYSSSVVHTRHLSSSYSSPSRTGYDQRQGVISPTVERSPADVKHYPEFYNMPNEEGKIQIFSPLFSEEDLAVQMIVGMLVQLWKERLTRGIVENEADIQRMDEWLEEEQQRKKQMKEDGAEGNSTFDSAATSLISRQTIQKVDTYAQSDHQEKELPHSKNPANSGYSSQHTSTLCTSTKTRPYHQKQQSKPAIGKATP
eukprot:6500973-Ditylum_brightwellii.AAC.1